MTADELIRAQAAYYLDPIAPLLKAWYIAEGGTPSTFIKAIQCSFPQCASLEEALARGAKTIRSRIMAYCDFCDGSRREPLFVLVKREEPDPWTGEQSPRVLRFSDAFIAFCGAYIAPVGAANDPTNLNANWVGNVQRIYGELITRRRGIPRARPTYA